MLLTDTTLLKDFVKCRDKQIDLLNTYLWSDVSICPPALLIHGAPSTGKSTVLETFLSDIPHTIINAEECVTAKMLLQRSFRSVVPDSEFEIKSDNLSDFFRILEKAQKGQEDKSHILVLDRIDTIASTDLIHSFARHTELAATNLVVIFTINSVQPFPFFTSSIISIHFPQYTKEEAIEIIQSQPLQEVDADFWSNFITVVVNALDSYTGSDIRLIRDVAMKLWPEYIRPLQEGRIQPNEHQKLYRECEQLFTSEWAVSNSLVDSPSEHDLPNRCKYILCAAYLASYNPTKTDIRFFSKAKDLRVSKRQIKNEANGKNIGLINRRSLAAPSFEMERMLAILHAINENADSTVTLQNYIATLSTLRLLLRVSSVDPLSVKARWKINVDWNMIQKISQDINFEIKDYLYE